MSVTKKYMLGGLCCRNCAAAIEQEIRQIEGVTNVALDFSTSSVTVTFDGDVRAMLKTISDIAVGIDDDIVVRTS